MINATLGPMGRLRNKVEQECKNARMQNAKCIIHRSALWDACVTRWSKNA